MAISTLTGNSGGAVSADGLGTIDVVGDNTQGITNPGTPLSNLIDVEGITSSTSQKGFSTFSATEFQVSSGAVSLQNQTNLRYIGKHGNDSYDGLNIESSKLTFNGASGSGNLNISLVLDAGTYTDTIVIPQNVLMPNGIFDGVFNINIAQSYMRIGKIKPSSAKTSLNFDPGAANNFFHIDMLLDSNSSTTNLFFNSTATFCQGFLKYANTNATALLDGNGSVYARFLDVNIVGSSAFCDARVLIGNIGKCQDDGSGTFITASNVGASALFGLLDFNAIHTNNVFRMIGAACLGSGVITAGTFVRMSDTTEFRNCQIGVTEYTTGRFSELKHDGITSGYSDSEDTFTQSSVQTTDATVTDLIAIPVSTNRTIAVQARVNGIQSTFAKAISARVFATFRRDSGNLVLVGTPTIDTNSDSGSLAVAVTADTGSQEATITVQGIGGETYNWVGSYNYNYLVDNT